MKKQTTLKLAWRIGLPNYDNDADFARLLALVKQQRPIMDEFALFDSITHHQYIPLDVYTRQMEMTAGRMVALRAAGVPSVGINVLCTIGHINEGWSYMPPLPYQGMVGHDGGVATGCACPNSTGMREYVRAKYELVARAKPDFIWVDDDIRVHHHGVAWGCFCPVCLDLFAKRVGKTWEREALVKAFDQPGQAALREAWIQQNIATIESLMAEIEAAIHKVAPKMAIGLMTSGPGWTTYSGMALDRWFPALKATKARPGGGFYCDATPMDMVRKSIDCGWQRASLPPGVTDIQYEVENFPYQLLKKSGTALIDECTLALAQGHNGIAFNLFGLTTNYEDFMPLVQRIPAVRPLWEKWVEHVDGLPTTGLWSAWSRQLVARRKVRAGESWLSPPSTYDVNRPMALAELGLPIATDAPGCGTVLCGRVAEAFSDDQLKGMLSGGVLLDSTALEVLAERGLASLTGVRLAKRLDNGLRERFTGDALNGCFKDHVRDARIEFWGDARGLGDVLEPTAAKVRVLAVMEDYFGRTQGPCMTAFENELGGRVVVMGYAPWIFLHSVAKRLQFQNAADWLSRGKAPVRIDETVPLVPIVRMSANRRKAGLVLLNAGLDTIPEATIHIRASAKRVRILEPGQRDRNVSLKPGKLGGQITLRDLPPWSVRVILVG
jgi:hypothetical protein